MPYSSWEEAVPALIGRVADLSVCQRVGEFGFLVV